MPESEGAVPLPKAKFFPNIPNNWVPNKSAYQCPYCGVLSTLTPLVWTYEHWVCQCDNSKCGKIFYAKVKWTGTIVSVDYNDNKLNFNVLETYPKYVPQRHESIPQNIWNDYLEACLCFDVGAFKSSVVMCRRMLQNICLKRGASKKDVNGNRISLRNQIKFAFPHQDYSLIHAFADKIKYFGDYGAHPQDDNIDDVTLETSKAILDFSYNILDITYIVPWRLSKV
jgi:hypothetical protein